MSSGMTVDLAAFKSDMRRFSKEHNVEIGFVIKNQMGLWASDVLNRMPPSKQAGGGSGNNKSKGKASVETDIMKVIRPMNPEALDFFADVLGTKGRGKRTKAAVRQELPPEVKLNWQGDQAALRAHHLKHRRASGHVLHKRRVVRDYPAAGWSFDNVMYAPRVAVRRYIRTVQKNVGNLKRGFVPGALKWKGRVPAWLKSGPHPGVAMGTITASGRGALIARNETPYASKFTRFVDQALYTRKQDLKPGGKAWLRMARLIERENAKA